MRIDLVKDKRISILGMARSGVAVAELIKGYGGVPFVSDMKSRDQLASATAVLDQKGIAYETGGHTERALTNVDFLVVSPGIPGTAPIIKDIERRHLPMFSEIEVTSWLCRATIVAITGTNGKSTTTALTAHLLATAGKRAVATGNIGSPFAHDVLGLNEEDFAVVEASSFQLERIESFKPKVAAILNITPDHLDRYASFDDYAAAKFRIADFQDAADFLVLNADDATLQSAKFWGQPKIVHFSASQAVAEGVFVKDDALVFSWQGRSGMICPTRDLGIPGPHNVANSAAAATMALALSIDPQLIGKGLRSFKGIAHRIEFVAEIDGVRYVNDSKATNVDSVVVALQSFERPLIMIMGGRDKHGDYTVLAPLMKSRVKKILLIGEATPIIEKQLHGLIPMQEAGDMQNALRLAADQAVAGDVVLLSPACASFDQFRDFEDRGDQFKRMVLELQKERQR